MLLGVRLVFTLEGKAFPLSAFDCENPTNIVTQQLPKDCQVQHDPVPDTPPEVPTENYSIVQQVEYYEFQAKFCQMTLSRHLYDCVWKSHIRLAAASEIHRPVDTSIEQCA